MDVNAIVENFRQIFTKQYVDFNGRTARAPFWYYVLACFVLWLAASILDSVFGFDAYTPFGELHYRPQPVTALLELALLLPNLGLSIRRLHDTDRSGWWTLLWFIPFVGWAVLIYWYALPGTNAANKFGANPAPRPED